VFWDLRTASFRDEPSGRANCLTEARRRCLLMSQASCAHAVTSFRAWPRSFSASLTTSGGHAKFARLVPVSPNTTCARSGRCDVGRRSLRRVWQLWEHEFAFGTAATTADCRWSGRWQRAQHERCWRGCNAALTAECRRSGRWQHRVRRRAYGLRKHVRRPSNKQPTLRRLRAIVCKLHRR
jgi:hypothetical protein